MKRRLIALFVMVVFFINAVAMTGCELSKQFVGADGKDGINGVDGKDGSNGIDGITPMLRINQTTYDWEVSYDNGSTWTSMGIKATGEKGDTGEQGPQGEKGDAGEDGVGISGVEKISSNGTVDTYRITFTNGASTTFNVKNGEDGESIDENLIKDFIVCETSEQIEKLHSDFAKALISQWQYQMYNSNIQTDATTVDVILFAGQSNMCGRAQLDDPENLGVVYDVDINDAFTYNSNNEKTKIVEPITANGSSGYGLIPAFLNAYHETTGRTVCACFHSVGGVMLNKFLPYTYDSEGNRVDKPTSYYKSMFTKISSAKANLESDGYSIGNVYLVWLQGEADALYYGSENDYANSVEKELTQYGDKVNYYYENFSNLVSHLQVDVALSKAFIIRIGHRGQSSTSVNMTNACIIEAQNRLGKENADCVLVSTVLAGAKAYTRPGESAPVNLMRDTSHYLLEMYNYAGIEAGINAGIYVNSGHASKPILYEYNNDYLKSVGLYEESTYDYELEKYLYIPNKNGVGDFSPQSDK